MMIELKNIKELIENALKKSKKLKEVYLKNNWEYIIGEVSKKSFPLFLNEKTLYIVVENNVVMHYIFLKKEKIIEKCNEILNETYINDLSCKIGKVDEVKKNFFGGKNE
ncbi:MAG: DUF721 domain-containing protein [Fusobacteriaceae bacterium]